MTNYSDEILYSRGLKQFRKNQLDNSLDFLLCIKRKNLNTFKLISQIHIKKNDYKNAKLFLSKILNLDKANLFALNSLGELNKSEKNYEEAEKFYIKSISCDENFAPAYFNLASLYEDKGELELARKHYHKVIKIDNKNYAAFFNLQRLDKNFINDEIIKKIANELKNSQNLKNKNTAYGHFILANYYRKKKEISLEIKELSKGHEIFFNSDRMNKDAVNYWLETVPKMTNKSFLFSDNNNNKIELTDIEPIFIFGIPRSGTTLVETIITSGKEKICNAGENFILQKTLHKSQLKKKILESEDSITIDINFLRKEIIESYKKQLSIQSNKFKFIDRTMTNFFFAEILLEIFPQAKIINCKRDSFHNLVAIYQQCLNNLPWSHKVEDIKKYISIYNYKLNNLEKNYSKNILNVELKRLTESPKDISKEIMSFCKLNWSEKVLKYYERKDLICTTASNIQIREKIFKYESAKFLPYKEYFDNF
ncbi:sulfotransferase [Candidatus Pelagibacter sp.]|nr:sulfotransferase [Candidatus Pelagibacter sp.]